MMQREPREKNEAFLGFLRSLVCLLCGDNTSVEPAHIRHGDPSICKRDFGMGEKPHDRFALPLCRKHHDQQHKMSERGFWEVRDIDPNKVSTELYLAFLTKDHERAMRVCEANRR